MTPCTKHVDPENYAWKRCDTHGFFPVWFTQCPDSPIPTTGDPDLDMAIDSLLAPGTSEGQRDRVRNDLAAGVLRHKPSRLVPLESR